MRKVVVTGLGAVTPLGNSVNETWEGIKAGKSGIGLITKFDATDYACKIAGEVKDFDPTNYMDKKDARKMGLYSQYAVAAAKMALEDAGLSKETIDGDRTGVLLGNGIGGFEILEAGYKKYFESGNTRIPPLTIPQLITNEAPGNVSMLFGLHGTALSLATACASGTDALGVALDQVRSGRLDMCLASGTDIVASMVVFEDGKPKKKEFKNSELYHYSSPQLCLNEAFPITYNSGGMLDFFCAGEARRMSKALDEIGVRNKYQIGKNLFNSGHCYVKRIPFAPARRDMLKIMTWYKDEMLLLGTDMTEGYARIEKFLTNYHKVLKGKIEC